MLNLTKGSGDSRAFFAATGIPGASTLATQERRRHRNAGDAGDSGHTGTQATPEIQATQEREPQRYADKKRTGLHVTSAPSPFHLSICLLFIAYCICLHTLRELPGCYEAVSSSIAAGPVQSTKFGITRFPSHMQPCKNHFLPLTAIL